MLLLYRKTTVSARHGKNTLVQIMSESSRSYMTELFADDSPVVACVVVAVAFSLIRWSDTSPAHMMLLHAQNDLK